MCPILRSKEMVKRRASGCELRNHRLSRHLRKLVCICSMSRFTAAFSLFCAMAHGAAVSEFIFENAPFASAHASNIIELRNGDLLASCFGGSAEGRADVAIWCSRRVAGKWSMPAVLVREPNIPCYNPVVFYSKDGRLWLYYKFGPSPGTWSGGRRCEW